MNSRFSFAYDALGVNVQHDAPSKRHSLSRTVLPKISESISFSIVQTPRSNLASSGYGHASADNTGNPPD
jgi:hypothetical protein